MILSPLRPVKDILCMNLVRTLISERYPSFLAELEVPKAKAKICGHLGDYQGCNCDSASSITRLI